MPRPLPPGIQKLDTRSPGNLGLAMAGNLVDDPIEIQDADKPKLSPLRADGRHGGDADDGERQGPDFTRETGNATGSDT